MSSADPARLRDMTTEDRSRWIALYVLCAGVLMIVLDVTIVNVALPSIQDDLGFSASSLAWVVNAYLIAFGGLLLLAGRLGDLIGRRTIFLAGLGRLHQRVAALRPGAERGHARRRALRAGHRRRDDVGRRARHDRDDVPRARASRRRRSASTRSSRRPAARSACCRRRAHAGDQLALDLLRQRADRHRHRDLHAAPARPRRRHRPRRGRRRPRRRADHRRADARRLHDRQARGRGRLGRDVQTLALGAVSLALLAAFVAARVARRARRSCRCGSSARAT